MPLSTFDGVRCAAGSRVSASPGLSRRNAQLNCVVRASRPQNSSTCRRSVSGVGRKVIVPRPISTAALMRPPAMATNTSPAGSRNSKSSARTTRSCARNARVGSSSRWKRPSTIPDVVAFVRRHVPSGAGDISSVQVARRPSAPASMSASAIRRTPPPSIGRRSRSRTAARVVRATSQRSRNARTLGSSGLSVESARKSDAEPAPTAASIFSSSCATPSVSTALGCPWAKETWPRAATLQRSTNAAATRRRRGTKRVGIGVAARRLLYI